MKNTLRFTLLSFIALLLVACSSTDSNDESSGSGGLEPKSTSVKGELGDYFEVVGGSIKEKDGVMGKEYMLSIEVKKNDKEFPFDVKDTNPFGIEGGEKYHVGFGAEVFGNDGAPITTKSATSGSNGIYSHDDVKGAIGLKSGETAFLRFNFNEDEGKEITSFQATSALEEEVVREIQQEKVDPNKVVKDAFDEYGKALDKTHEKYQESLDETKEKMTDF